MSTRLDRTRVLTLVAILGTAYFGLVILLLSLLDTDYDPITQLASDYGVGRFAIVTNLGFLIGGIGMCAFALAYATQKTQVKSRAASAFLIVAGLVLIMDSYFTTNLEGAPATLHGTIHGFGGLFFFIAAPIGILLVSRKIHRNRFLETLAGLIVGFVILGAPDNAGGLAERLILLVIFSSVIVDSLSLYRISVSRSSFSAVVPDDKSNGK
jgi:hypothetical membrane protein